MTGATTAALVHEDHPRPGTGAAGDGATSWDERFLRGLLKQDPNSTWSPSTSSDLGRYTQTRNPGGAVADSLPDGRIFDASSPFDVVVFQNSATPSRRSIASWRNLEATCGGGGLGPVIGGDHAFGEGGLSVLDHALPVDQRGPAWSSRSGEGHLRRAPSPVRCREIGHQASGTTCLQPAARRPVGRSPAPPCSRHPTARVDGRRPRCSRSGRTAGDRRWRVTDDNGPGPSPPGNRRAEP